MAKQDSREDLEKALRLSRRALPVGAVLGIVAVAVVWALQVRLQFPSWIAWGLSIFAVFGPVGDALNVVWCRQKLRHGTAADE